MWIRILHLFYRFQVELINLRYYLKFKLRISPIGFKRTLLVDMGKLSEKVLTPILKRFGISKEKARIRLKLNKKADVLSLLMHRIEDAFIISYAAIYFNGQFERWQLESYGWCVEYFKQNPHVKREWLDFFKHLANFLKSKNQTEMEQILFDYDSDYYYVFFGSKRELAKRKKKIISKVSQAFFEEFYSSLPDMECRVKTK